MAGRSPQPATAAAPQGGRGGGGGRRRQLSRCGRERPGQRHPRVPLCDSARFRARVLAGRPGPACACAIPRVLAPPNAAGRDEEGRGGLARQGEDGNARAGTSLCLGQAPRRAAPGPRVRRRRGQPGVLGSGAAAGSPGSTCLVRAGLGKAWCLQRAVDPSLRPSAGRAAESGAAASSTWL